MEEKINLHEQIFADLHEGVPGRVHKPEFVKFWEEEVKAPKFVLKVLKQGFRVCFENNQVPGRSALRNNASARNNSHFVELSINRMTQIGVCSEINSPPYILNPLSVVDTGKKRVVLDVSRTINPYSQYKKVSLGSLYSFNEYVEKGDYMAILDIKNAYYHFLVAQDNKKFFGFTWTFSDGRVRYFQMDVLFLGINRAVQFFHDMTQPIIAYCQKNGTPLVAYLDDLRTTAHSWEKCIKQLTFVRDTLQKAGFVLNNKSSVEPKQIEKFLGIVNNFREMIYQMPKDKKEKYRKVL